MPTSSHYWADLSSPDFAALQTSGAMARTIAVLPLGATEQHGPHLPLSVDTVLARGMVAATVAQLKPQQPVLFLPLQAVGLSPEHAAFAGTLTLKNDTVLRLWRDIAESVAASGVRKLVLFNTHGGHVGAMDMVARELRACLGMLVYSVSWFNLPLLDAQGQDLNALFSADEHRFGIHGGEIETSIMLALDPSHVNLAQAQNFTSTAQARSQQLAIVGNGKSAKLAWQMQDYNLLGAVGNAAAATAEKGQALVAATGRAMAQLLAEIEQVAAPTIKA